MGNPTPCTKASAYLSRWSQGQIAGTALQEKPWEASGSSSEPLLLLPTWKSCFQPGSSEEEEEEDGAGALLARKGWHQVPVQTAGEADLTNNRWNVQCLFYKLVIYMTTDARLSLLVWMPGHLGFIFLSFPLQPWGLAVFLFFPNEIEQELQDSGNKISAATISRKIYDQKKISQNHRNWHTDILGFGIPSKGRISQARRVNCPFWWVKGMNRRAFSGLTREPAPCPGIAAPCGTSQVAKGLHSPRGHRVKAGITHHVFLFLFVPIEAHHEVFLNWLSQSKALLTFVAKSFWFLERSIGWTLQKQVGPFCQTKILSHGEKRKEKAVIKQETKRDKCMLRKRILQLRPVNCITTTISWNRNYWQGRFSISLKLLLLTWTMAATGLLHLNAVLHLWAFNPQLPGWFGFVFFLNILSKSTHLLYLFWHGWGMGLTGAKPFPLHRAATAQGGLAGPSAPLKGSGASATARISQLLAHQPRSPQWHTADHSPVMQLPEGLGNFPQVLALMI